MRLTASGETLRSPGNLNNEIGLPLTLLKLNERHERAVLEMGFYVPGEIAFLCDIAQPQVGVVTNIGTVHAEGIGELKLFNLTALFEKTPGAVLTQVTEGGPAEQAGQAGVDVGGEVEGAGENVDQHHRRQDQALGGGREVGQIFLSAFVTFLVLVMRHQRISRDADDFVEEVKREQVVGERAADCAEQRQREAGADLFAAYEAARRAASQFFWRNDAGWHSPCGQRLPTPVNSPRLSFFLRASA